MSFSDLGSLGSFVSGLAILISLIYVSVQLRQAAKHQRSLMMQGRAARVQGLWLSVASSPDLASIWHKVLFTPESLNDSDMTQAIAFAAANFHSVEETWLEGRESLQPTKVHNVTAQRIAQMFASPFFRVTWSLWRPTLDPEFVAMADQLLRETHVVPPVAPDALRRAIAAETARGLNLNSSI